MVPLYVPVTSRCDAATLLRHYPSGPSSRHADPPIKSKTARRKHVNGLPWTSTTQIESLSMKHSQSRCRLARFCSGRSLATKVAFALRLSVDRAIARIIQMLSPSYKFDIVASNEYPFRASKALAKHAKSLLSLQTPSAEGLRHHWDQTHVQRPAPFGRVSVVEFRCFVRRGR